MQLIVGLGNPGDKYRVTRHNLGFLLLDSFDLQFKFEKKFNAEVAKYSFGDRAIVCIKPQTYMNRSGDSLAAYINFYQLDPKQCLVVHDELDLPFGELKLKFGGGEGGHNGLKSISQSLGTKDYPRLRMGIGKPEAGNLIPIEDWVLSKFRDSDRLILDNMFANGQETIRSIFELGFSKAQTFANRKENK